MRVLMLGWEFPPAIVGGLGTACFGLTRGLAGEGADVTFVVPHAFNPTSIPGVRFLSANPAAPPGAETAETGKSGDSMPEPGATGCLQPVFRTHGLQATRGTPMLSPDFPRVPAPHAYETAREYAERTAVQALGGRENGVRHPEVKVSDTIFPPADILHEVERYAAGVERVARAEPFDVIHAHDWMAYPAGLRAQAATGRPLICHVHATEFDRCGDSGNPVIVDIERRALRQATEVITVSRHTRHVVVQRYGVDPEHIVVVHNAIDADTVPAAPAQVVKPWDRVVVFLGRLAYQKGPEYFIEAAARALDLVPGTKFVLAGSGPALPSLVERVARLRLGKDILFAGFLDRSAVGRILRMADLYVMTSVHEPFGIAALEAMAHGVPVIIPPAAGVGEVVANVLRADFWDIQGLADRIVAVLKHAPLKRTLSDLGRREVGHLSWRQAARQCLNVYRRALESLSAPLRTRLSNGGPRR